MHRIWCSAAQLQATGAAGMGLLSQDWDTLAMVLAGALAGGFVNGLTGFGTALTTIGLVLIVYCSFMLAAGRIKLAAGARRAEMAIGFVGGILGGLAGLS